MKVIVLLFLVGAFASNIRHNKERELNGDSLRLTKQQTTRDTKTELVEVNESNENENAPFVEETLSEQQNLEEPKPQYNNDGQSPDMGKLIEDSNESLEAPMMADEAYDFSAQEQIISGVSFVQVKEIDALADVDTSMPLLDEDFKYDDQALQETPLNINIVDEAPQVQEESDAVIEKETAEMVDSLSSEIDDQQDTLINEVQLIQVGGFYY